MTCRWMESEEVERDMTEEDSWRLERQTMNPDTEIKEHLDAFRAYV